MRRDGSREAKFLLDSMLGRLARWVRMLGYDSIYSSENDDKLLETALREGRILVTSDKELHRRAITRGAESILVPIEGTEEQLALIAEYLKVRHGVSHGDFLRVKPVRCSICNGRLVQTSMNRWQCSSCGQEYWVGGHWRNISRTLSRVEGLLSQRAQR